MKKKKPGGEMGMEAPDDISFSEYDIKLLYSFSVNIVGPIISKYLHDLNSIIYAFDKQRDSKILFVSRAGVRIRRLYKLYLTVIEQEETDNSDYFWISRFMCAKGTWSSQHASINKIISEEFRGKSVRDVLLAIYFSCGIPDQIDMSEDVLSLPSERFGEFIWGRSRAAYFLRWYLSDQSMLFQRYVDTTLGEKRRVLLVDTGWQGTAQKMLADWRSDVDWWGAYFGRSGFQNSDRRYWSQMLGVVFESDKFDPARPETSIILHRHLIEGLFEPVGRSIEHLVEPAGKDHVEAAGAAILLSDAPTRDTDPLFAGVSDYVAALPRDITPSSLSRAASAAWAEIARMVTYPTRDEARVIGGMKRSADYGRELKVPVVLPPVARHSSDTAEERIAHSLWPQAQAVIEYPPEIAIERQRQANGGIQASDIGKILPPPTAPSVRCGGPRVAVITRTMNRPQFLRRAIASVGSQTDDNYIHVIVCDGGDIEAVRNTISESGADRRRTILIDNVVNRGMEAASNIAIKSCESDLIVIHDDDDTWQPTYLENVRSFLYSRNGEKYGGVITHSFHVSEEITPDGIKIHGKKGYNDWVMNVHLSELVIDNFFAPICFCYRRDVYQKIGGYDERLPVLGDWDFNVRFISQADIGVITEKLANYHHRDVGNKVLFGNSIIDGVSRHAEYASIMRNRFLREAAAKGGDLTATLVALGYVHHDMRRTVREARDAAVDVRGSLGVDRDIGALRQRRQAEEATADARWIALQFLLAKRRQQNPRDQADDELPLDITADAIVTQATAAIRTFSFSPPPDFDEFAYLLENPDVKAEVDRGLFPNGFVHYVLHGRAEGRKRP